MHGKVTPLHNQGTGVFGGLPEKFRVTRYHSLIVDKESVPSEWQVDAVAEDGAVMGISHKTLPLYGVHDALPISTQRQFLRSMDMRSLRISAGSRRACEDSIIIRNNGIVVIE